MRIFPNDEQIFLGEIFDYTIKNLISIGEMSPYDGWPEFKFNVSSILGIPTIEASLRSPFLDRPILQQQYELTFFENKKLSLEKQYISIITNIFGEPRSVENYNTKEWHSVRCSAKWEKDDYQISLSIYGSDRKHDKGVSTAGLYFDLIDEIPIAAPFLEQRKSLENNLWSDNTNIDIIFITQTVDNNFAFFRPDYEKNQDKIEKISDELRQSQKALYTRELLETPKFLNSNNSKNKICIWSCSGNYFISLNQDTVILNPGKTNFEYHVIQPARGSGGTQLIVGEIIIHDIPDSQSLNKLKMVISKVLKQKAKERKYYDD